MKRDISLRKKYEIAKKSDDELLKWRRIGSISYLYQGKVLKEIKEGNFYKYLGEAPEFENFETYVNSRSLDLRKAYYLIQIYATFCEKFKYRPEELSDTHWTALRSLLPVIDEKNVKELVEKAKILTRSHLETEIKQLKSGLDFEDVMECQHEEIREVRYFICQKCHERFKIQPKNSKIIEEK